MAAVWATPCGDSDHCWLSTQRATWRASVKFYWFARKKFNCSTGSAVLSMRERERERGQSSSLKNLKVVIDFRWSEIVLFLAANERKRRAKSPRSTTIHSDPQQFATNHHDPQRPTAIQSDPPRARLEGMKKRLLRLIVIYETHSTAHFTFWIFFFVF